MRRLLSSFPTENETNDFNRLDGLLKVLYETEYLLRSGVERQKIDTIKYELQTNVHFHLKEFIRIEGAYCSYFFYSFNPAIPGCRQRQNGERVFRPFTYTMEHIKIIYNKLFDRTREKFETTEFANYMIIILMCNHTNIFTMLINAFSGHNDEVDEVEEDENMIFMREKLKMVYDYFIGLGAIYIPDICKNTELINMLTFIFNPTGVEGSEGVEGVEGVEGGGVGSAAGASADIAVDISAGAGTGAGAGAGASFDSSK